MRSVGAARGIRALSKKARQRLQLDWLDSLLADGRQYLSGGRFSRADITVASLLGPCARPEQMKTYHDSVVPRALIVDFECWKDRKLAKPLEDHRFRKHFVSPRAAEGCVVAEAGSASQLCLAALGPAMIST